LSLNKKYAIIILMAAPETLDLLQIEQQEITRRGALKFVLGASAVVAFPGIAGCTSPHSPEGISTAKPAESSSSQPENHEADPSIQFLLQAGESLLNLGEEIHYPDGSTGLRYYSQMQDHYQTDCDVGAAGVIKGGFLQLARMFPEDKRWLEGAEKTSRWMRSASFFDATTNQRCWPDYADNGDVSTDIYTSYDDGVAGIIDTEWELFEVSKNDIHRQTSIEGLRWLLARTQFTGKNRDGARWKWDVGDPSSTDYYEGMGMGLAGIVYTLAKFHGRLKDSEPELADLCRERIDQALTYLEGTKADLVTELNSNDPLTNPDVSGYAAPETDTNEGQDGNTAINSGYLSGQAGEIFMYLELAEAFPQRKEEFFVKADKLFDWLENKDASNKGPMVTFKDGTVAWKNSLDPEGGNDSSYATGFEEGLAGIGWASLQAFGQTKNKHYRKLAMQAGDRLLKVAKRNASGTQWAWREYTHPNSELFHKNLNNGAAGIGTFLHDLYLATGKRRYQIAAVGARNWLEASKKTFKNGIGWSDTGKGDNNDEKYANDPSYHWGTAGIINFLVRMAGGKVDEPGEQPALPSKLLTRFK
jgi:hypothetical protein